MIDIPKSPNFTETGNPVSSGGTWHMEDFHITDPPTRIVILNCPQCGRGSTLWRPQQRRGTEHQIASDGTVTPSVVCPHPGCSFHEWVRLSDWTYGIRL